MTNTFQNDLSKIVTESEEFLSNQFIKGKGLTKTELKGFSGPSLEHTSEFILKSVIKNLQEKYSHSNIVWGKDYIKSDHVGFSDERLDQHVWVNGKLAFLQEDRAWVDKPFYTLKRAVIRNIMLSCESKLSKNVQFCIVGYCIDIKPEIMNTCNFTQGYGDRINMFSITGRRRGKKVNGKSVNWYETGYDRKMISDYVNYVYKTLEDAINETSDVVPRRLFA